MVNKKAVGRPAKVDYTVMGKLEDAFQHGENVSQACRFAGISRDTFYRYLLNQKIFAERMHSARQKSANISTIIF